MVIFIWLKILSPYMYVLSFILRIVLREEKWSGFVIKKSNEMDILALKNEMKSQKQVNAQSHIRIIQLVLWLHV